MNRSVLIVIIAIIIVIFGIYYLIMEINKIRKYSIIKGNLVEIIESSDSDGITYKPRISYSNSKGFIDYYTTPVASSFYIFKFGDDVNLLYDENNDRVIGILHVVYRFLLPYSIILIGISILLFSIAIKYNDIIFKIIKNY